LSACIPVVILLGKLRLRPFTFYLKLGPQIVKAKNNFHRILLLASDEKGKKKKEKEKRSLLLGGYQDQDHP
jgi:hypothetical protein